MTNVASIKPPVVPPVAPVPEFSPEPKRDWLRILTFAAIIVFAGLFVATPAFQGTWLWDDDQEISANAAVQSSAGNVNALKAIWTPGQVGADYLPVKTTFLWLEWKIFNFMGLRHDNTNPPPPDYQGNINVGYHVINAIFHILNALLIWNLFYRLKIKWAWLGGLLFAIHPVLVESVAWVTEQKNTLSLIFMLLSMIYYINYHERGKWGSLLASCILFLAAVLSKSAVIMLPFCLILYVWWRDNKFQWRDALMFPTALAAASAMAGVLLSLLWLDFSYLVAFTLPGVAGAAVCAGVWWMIKGSEWKYTGRFALIMVPFFVITIATSAITVHYQFEKAIGAELIPVGGLVSRTATAGMATWFYLLKCIWPFSLPPMAWLSSAFGYGLVPIYERWDVVHPTFVQLVVPWLAMAALLVWFAFKRQTWGRHMILGLGFFFGNLVPALGFITMSYMRITWVADHFVYISIIGVLGLVVAGVAALYEKIPAAGKPWYAGVGIAALALLAVNAMFYSNKFLNETNMWQYTLSQNPDAWQAHSRFGKVLLDHQKTDDAYYHIQQSNRLRPDLAETNNNMGVLLMQKNRLPEGLPYFQRAVRLMPIGAFLFNYANALIKAWQGAQAVPSYEKLIKMNGGGALAKYISDNGVTALNALFSERGGVTLGDVARSNGATLNSDLNNKNSALDRLLKTRLGAADYERVSGLQGGAALRELIKLHASDTLDDMLKIKSADTLEQLVKNKGGKALEALLRERGVLNDVLKMNGGDAVGKVFAMDAGNEAFFGLRATRGSDAYESLVMMMRPDPLDYMYNSVPGGDKLKQLLDSAGSDMLMKFHAMEGTQAYNIIADMMGGDPVIRMQEVIDIAVKSGGDPAQNLGAMGINDPRNMLTNYGAALMQAGRRDEALLAYQYALKVGFVSDAMVNYVLTLTQMNRGTEAVPLYEKLLQAGDPYVNNPMIVANYGIALAQANRKDDSIRALERALQINPNMPDVQRILEQLKSAQPAIQAPVLPSLPSIPPLMPGNTDPAQLPIPSIFQNQNK